MKNKQELVLNLLNRTQWATNMPPILYNLNALDVHVILKHLMLYDVSNLFKFKPN